MPECQTFPTPPGGIPPKGLGLHRLIRGALAVRGSSLRECAEACGVDHRNLAKVLHGKWTGPKADEVYAKALAFAGLEQAASEHPTTEEAA